ncbi:helix-turn-helix transcriptional regulator [Paenibacillus dokdonensis]|uniref:Helix-turn-helix transcriptional regulator n=1 Tax=Paenibacillus dokdonensis TaxID=2567944 RepID=A0ABU6GI72_9BACL|nr:helix-turn-helix transcriptional regulator [Paenibacillus dokdonensis]MEC0239445.1 helix-turn-helix transcriptional regulator [Paenibacillus dokdonensis]
MANRLKELRKAHKISGIVIAKQLEITPQYYYDIEKGERRLTMEIAAKLVPILHATVDYIIGVADVNTYGTEETNNSDPHEESELAGVAIDRLNQYKLSYKGHDLSKEDADYITELLEAALKRWKK